MSLLDHRGLLLVHTPPGHFFWSLESFPVQEDSPASPCLLVSLGDLLQSQSLTVWQHATTTLSLLVPTKVWKFTFHVAIVLRMVLRFFVKGDLDLFGHILPLFWCRILEKVSQLYGKLETDKWETVCIIGIHKLICNAGKCSNSTWTWPLCLCRQSCWHCNNIHQVAWHLNGQKVKSYIYFYKNTKKSIYHTVMYLKYRNI